MLLMDVGHTRIKWVCSGAGCLSAQVAFPYKADRLKEQLREQLKNVSPSLDVYIACVADRDIRLRIQDWFDNEWQGNVFFAQSQVMQAGVQNGYDDPLQLGVDRWLAMLAAYEKYKSAVCVIDCGTAVTFDIVDNEGMHLGGLIIPGLDMMHSALISGLDFDVDGRELRQVLARNTGDAIFNGCLEITLSGLAGLYRRYAEQLPGLRCLVTGGDAQQLLEYLAGDCELMTDLVLDGLKIYAEAMC
ncbi:MAG: type III pantothenate kinase [Gammaproteobacteria bacterium]|nr:type III pantothenate kinase [Gammaproteobacteria bacterium]